MRGVSYRDSIDYLFGLEKSGIKLGLDRTVGLLSAIGDPHAHFKSVHIAGTNGKGSVACFLSSILSHNGAATGLFTSPHLVDFRERIRKDGAAIARADLSRIVARIRPSIDSIRASYFEATTAVGFEYFRRKRVDVAVVEVGMGGRLDSTNVLRPLATCITSIGLDHEWFLGDTLAKIAAEKAGILKPGVPAVCGVLPRSARRTVLRTARALGAPVYELGTHATARPLAMGLGGSTFEYRGLRGRTRFRISLPGRFQVDNATLAVLTAEVLAERGLPVSKGAIRAGLRSAFWPGRFQVLAGDPLVVCDGAHNVSGARALVESLRDLGLDAFVTVFGVLNDKDYGAMLALVSSRTREFVFTRPRTPRALPLWKLRQEARRQDLVFREAGRVDAAVSQALTLAGRGGKVLVCGSLYTLGEAMQCLGFSPVETLLC